ncbi:MAG: NUDIX domain-containing protein [Angustibacter sp.]
MVTRSAGILLYRYGADGTLEVLVGHMGGPFWAHRDQGAWSIPKGEYGEDEDAERAARREFVEELGLPVPKGPMRALGEVRQPSGKRLSVWALEGDLDVTALQPGTFELEWPPKSGQLMHFPEIDRAGWLDVESARPLLTKGQRPFLDLLLELLRGSADPP